MLAPMDGFLTDEARYLPLQLGIGGLVSVVTHRPHEEVLSVRKEAGQHGGEVAEDEVAVCREVLRQLVERTLEGDAAGGDLAVGQSSVRHAAGIPVSGQP